MSPHSLPSIGALLKNFISYDSDGITSIGTLLNATIGPTYTYNIRLDEDGSSDRTATFLGNLTEEIASVCASIAADPILRSAPAINGIGFSQGGQFLRAYVEKCNDPPMKNLATFGSQHNGITEFENCESSALNPLICAAWAGILKSQTWSTLAQSKLVPAQYYRDPTDLENYLEYSNWLADVNNEREVKNATYKENLGKLERFWMYMFSADEVVVPPETAWFADVVRDGEERNVTGLRERMFYKEDWIGLRALDEHGKLEFRVAEGGHMNVTEEELGEVFEMMYGKDT